ncbi:MAG: serine hydrolase, partial [Bacteroidota bacterium]
MATAKLLLFSLLFVLVPPLFSQSASEQIQELDAYIDQARKQWKVPGLAIAVVKDGATLFSKGYGLRDLSKNEEIDAQTVFAMASTTKAVTALAMAMLVDEGLVNWGDRVIDHLPEFRLMDPYVTREVRVKDLFTHNAGLGNADVLWYGLKLDSKEIVRRMRYIEPAYSFRGGYTYQNLMYLVAGQLIERVSGVKWEAFIRDRIFAPLNMVQSFPTQALSRAYSNRSTPHMEVRETITPILDTDADMIGPAGSGWTCVEDASKWMNFLLDSARIEGERLVSAKNFSLLFRPQIVIPYESFYASKYLTHPTWTTYALGWFQHDYQGRAVSFHTGSLAGTVAICGLIPKERLGVYILGNLDHAEVRHALMYKVFDLFGPEGTNKERDWSSEFWELYQDTGDTESPWEPKPIEGKVKLPDFPLEDYTGIYTHELWGEIHISLNGKSLKAKYGGFVFDLLHWNNNTFWGQPRPWDWVEYV